MKRFIYHFVAALLLISPLSCKKDDPAPVALASAAEADAAEDSKSGGVYKGALIGSSGIIKIVLQKGVKEIQITLDGVKKTLTTTSLSSWTSGQDIVGAVFSSGDWSVSFSVDGDGENGAIAFDIPGHPDIIPVMVKEKSTGQVKAYEGSYAGTDAGTWNFVEKNGVVYGISRSSTPANGGAEFYGQVTGTNIVITVLTGGTGSIGALGTINGNSVTGTWEESADNKGTWTGTRTL